MSNAWTDDMPTSVCVVDDDNYKDVLSGTEWVLVDLWAPWCGPCQQLKPAVEAVAHRYVGRVRVCGVNVDEAPLLATKYDVQALPTLLLMRAGQLVHRKVGVLSQHALETILDSFLGESIS